MRIETLKMSRYGMFTDHMIDFGLDGTDNDLHVIFGANEAGKSTLRDAVIDFLYGFPTRTPYSFLHANDALQIEATMQVGDAKHQFVRVKRVKNSLLTAENQPASEDVIRGVLGDIGRAGFENLFSLDENTLEQGGESILRSEGDLGELLFSSASGLSSLSSALSDIRAETALFFKKPGRSHRLAEMKKELVALRSDIRERDVLASQYSVLVKEEETARERHAQAKVERDEELAGAARLKSLLDLIESWRDYQSLCTALADLADAPELPNGWLVEAEQLTIRSAKIQTSISEAERSVTRVRSALDDIKVPKKILSLGQRIDRLAADDIEAKFRTSDDIEIRTREHAAVKNDIQVLVQQLGATEKECAEQLLLPAATKGRIKGLIEPLSGLDADERTAAEEVERAQDVLEEARAIRHGTEAAADFTVLAETLAAIREDGDDRDRAQIDKRFRELTAEHELALSQLAPWAGTAMALTSIGVPTQSVIDEWCLAASQNSDSLDVIARELERLEDDRSRLNVELKTVVATADSVGDERAKDVRAARDAAWQAHRDGFGSGSVTSAETLNETADAMQVALAEDDHVSATRFLRATEIAEIRKLEADLARTVAASQRNHEKQQALVQDKNKIADETAKVNAALGLPKDCTLDFIESWLTLRAAALIKSRELSDVVDERAQIQQRIESALQTLMSAMANAGIAVDDADWRTSVGRCESAIESWREQVRDQSAAAATAKKASTELKARQRRHNKAQKAIDAWRADWADVLRSCWIGAGDRIPTPAETTEVLHTLDQLVTKLDKARDLQSRIEAMQANRDTYVGEVEALAGSLGVTVDEDGALKTADELRAQLATARENERRRQEKREEFAETETRLNETNIVREQIDTRFTEMTNTFPAADFDALLAAMRRAETKQSLQNQTGKLEKLFTDRLGASDFEAAQQELTDELSDAGAAALMQGEYDALMAASKDVNEHVSSLYHDWKKAETALATIGDDAEVARLAEQACVLLLDIQSQAQRFVSLSAGTILVDRALSIYLDTHRSSMLERASEAFAAITRGAFTGLDAMPGKNSEVLVGLRGDGSSLLATEMSRGTRFQLYLSLRIAGYREFVKHRESLPFFADDILETFDDGRSAETFSLMAKMAESGQVIYLTHHRHLCELAQKVTKGRVTIHELPDRAVHSDSAA